MPTVDNTFSILYNLYKQKTIVLFTALLGIVTLTMACVPIVANENIAQNNALAIQLIAPKPNKLQTHVETMPLEGDPIEIEGSHAELTTTDDAAMMRFQTAGLEPGHIYTAWWIIINHPELCSASPCSAEDVLARTDVVGAEITQADGLIANDRGIGEFTGYLTKGVVDKPWFGHGLIHPKTAEIHIVINAHGPAIAEMAADMLTSYRGGCTDVSLPPPFPDTAKSDGLPGPNACQLVQDAIFQQ